MSIESIKISVFFFLFVECVRCFIHRLNRLGLRMPRVKRQQAIWLCFGQIRRYFDLWMHKPSSRARSSHHICAAFVRHMSDCVCVVFAFDVIRSLIDKTTSHKMKRMNKMRVVSLMAAVIVWIRSDVYDYFNGHPLKCVAFFFFRCQKLLSL